MLTSTQREQTSLTKAAQYSHIARVSDLESQHGDQDHPSNLIKSFLYHCIAILKISLKFVHDLLSND